MELIKTPVIDPVYDALWGDAEALAAGAAHKPVLIITAGFTNDSSDHEQLKRMLAACKLSADKYNLVTLAQGQVVAWHKLKDLLAPGIIFLIGIAPVQLGISALFNLNYPNNFDGCSWLPTLSLGELSKHDEMKKQLWANGMKPLFIDNPLPEAS